MRVAQCMTRDVKLITPDVSVVEAAKKMKDGNLGALPIGENDRLVGMVTDRDITTRAVAEEKDLKLLKVRELMSPGVSYCFMDEEIDEVAEKMDRRQLRRLPVLNRDKRLVGIISLADINHHRKDLKMRLMNGNEMEHSH